MLPLARNGYTEQEIIDTLHAKKGSRKIDFKYNLLDKTNVFLKELSNVLEGGVKYASFNDIKRTATFKVVDDGSINFLSDRIQPIMELEMPKKVVDSETQPFFSRGSIAYLSDGSQVTGHDPRFENGMFNSKGLMIETNTTNLVPNPIAKTDLTAIAVVNGGGAVSSVSRETNLPTGAPLTTGVKHTTTTAGDSNVFFNQASGSESANSIPVLPNTTYNFSAWVYIASSTITSVYLRPIEWTSASALVKDTQLILAPSTVGKWHKLSGTMTTQSTTGKISIRFRANGTGDIYVTGVQLEQKAYETTFTEGTRNKEQLQISSSILKEKQSFSIDCWTKLNHDSTNDFRMIFSSWQKFYVSIKPNTLGRRCNISWYDEKGLQQNADSNPFTVDFTEWNHWGFSYDGFVCKLYLNGVLIAQANTNLPKNFKNLIEVGSMENNYFLNGIIDDFRISSCVRTQEEFARLYNDKLPSKVDKDTIYKMDFNGDLKGKVLSTNNKVEFPLGVFLLASPKRSDSDNNVIREVEAYDGLLILTDDKLQDAYTITAGTNYKTAVITLLQGAGITQYIIEDTTKTLTTTQVFDIGKSKLSVVNELLSQINYTPIRVDVYGNFVSSPYIAPSSRGVEYTYKDDSLSITYKGMSENLDLFNIPNKWVVVATNSETVPLKSVYTNENADSITSTVNRGRTIVDYREIDNIADQQSLDAYTVRIANESSQIFGQVEFETAIMPHHEYQDLLKVEYTKLGINDKYVETDWSFNFQAGAKMKHTVRKVVTI